MITFLFGLPIAIAIASSLWMIRVIRAAPMGREGEFGLHIMDEAHSVVAPDAKPSPESAFPQKPVLAHEWDYVRSGR